MAYKVVTHFLVTRDSTVLSLSSVEEVYSSELYCACRFYLNVMDNLCTSVIVCAYPDMREPRGIRVQQYMQKPWENRLATD